MAQTIAPSEQIYEGYLPRAQGLANQYLRGIPEPQPQPSQDMNAGPQPTASGPMTFLDFVKDAETQKGNKLSDAELDNLKSSYATEFYTPYLYRQKGATQGSVEAGQAALESKYARFRQQYLGEPVAGAEGASGEGPGYGRELLAQLLGGGAQAIPGALGLIDNIYRLGAGAVNEAITPGDQPAMTDRTWLGDIAAGASKGISNVVDRNTSEETKRQQAAIQQQLGDDASLEDTIAAYVSNPRVLGSMAAAGVGSLVPGAAVTRIPAILSRLQKLGPLARRASMAAIVGAPQSSTIAFENQIDETDINDLIEINPKFKDVYAAAQAAGMEPATAEIYTKNYVKNTGGASVVASNLVGNVGLASIPGLGGAEAAIGRRALGGTATQGLLRRILGGSASEAGQEGLAGATQAVGENVGLGREDLTQGAGQAAGEGGLVGALVGGAVNVPGARGNALRKNKKSTATPAAGTQTATPEGATATGDQAPTGAVQGTAAATPPAPAPMEAKAFDKARTESLAKVQRLSKNRVAVVTRAKTADEYLDAVTTIARAQTGENWANLDGLQRLDIVEGAIELLQKKAPNTVEGVGEAISAARIAMQPTGGEQVTERPLPEELLNGDTTNTAEVVNSIITDPEQTVEELRNKLKKRAAKPTATGTSDIQGTRPTTPNVPNTKLPSELAGAKPNYGLRPLQFENDTHKALYIVSQSKKSKSDAKYRKFLNDSGISDEQIASLSTNLRSRVKGLASSGSGPIVVPANVFSALANVKPAEAAKASSPEAAQAIEAVPEEATRPKQEAPAQDEAGAQNETPVVSQPAQESAAQTNLSDELDTTLRGIVGNDLIEGDFTEVSAAAREGLVPLNAKLKTLQDDEFITREQARAVRDAAKAYKDSQQVETVSADSIELDEAITEAKDNADTAEIGEYEDLRANLPQATSHDLRLEEIRKTIKSFRDRLTAGELNLDQAVTESKRWVQLRDIYIQGPQRGIDEVRAQLARLKESGNPNATQAADFATWLLDQNPNLATDVAVNIAKLEGRAAGGYDPISMFVTLAQDGVNPTTAVHEILHHTERMLPPAIQEGLRNEYLGRLYNKRKQSVTRGNTAAVEYIDKIYEYLANPTKATKAAVIQHVIDNRESLPKAEFYKYSNQSEYWAEEGTRILNGRYAADSWAAKAKVWVTEFFDKLKAFLGLPNTSELYKALDAVLNSTGEQQSPTMLNVLRDLNLDITEEVPEGMQNSNVTAMQWVGEVFANSAYALEKSVQDTLRAGGIVTPETNPMLADYRYNSDTNFFNNQDTREVVEPVSNWVQTNWQQFGNTIDETLDGFNTYFQNKNFLERVHTSYLLNVDLKDNTDFDRDNIIEDMREGAISPREANRQLEQLVTANAAQSEEEFYDKQRGKNGIKLQTIRDQLARLETENNISDTTMSELNSLIDPARERNIERLKQAGLVAEDDPWVEFYGWDYYVPLKDFAYGNEQEDDFDLPSSNPSIASLSRQLETMQGRTTLAERPFTRLFVDTLRAGERAANKKFMDSIYDYITDNQELFGAEIRVFDGTAKDGYTDEDGNEIGNKIPRTGKELVINDGRQHYVVTLDPKGQLLRGLQERRNIFNLNRTNNPLVKGLRTIGKGTNILSRIWTTISPEWQTAVGFVRDLTQVPVTFAVTEYANPMEAATFFAGYGKNVLQSYRTLRYAIEALKGDQTAIVDMAEADPDSAAGWLVRYERNGGSNNFTEGFDIQGMDNLLAGGKLDGEGIFNAPKTATNTILKYTGNYANFLEKIGRVAAFRTLVEQGMPESEAAIKVRMTLDYSQSGKYGRVLNSWLAFYRVGATNADVMRRAFTKPLGGFDTKKFINWAGSFTALGAIGYMMQSALLGVDEDDNDRIKKMRANTITSKMLIPVGDTVIGVNIGLGLPQLLLAPGILGAAVESGHITYTEALEEMYEVLGRNGSPVRPTGRKEGSGVSGFVNSWMQALAIPSVVGPIRDIDTNVDAFGREIAPERYRDSGKFASDSGRNTTPKFFGDIATFIREKSGDTVDMYPEDVRYLMRTYGGQIGSSLIKDLFSKQADEDAGKEGRSGPLLSKLAVEDEKFYYENELYRTLESLRGANRRLEAVKAKGGDAESNKLLASNTKLSSQVTAYKALMKARQKFNKEVKAIRENKLVSAERKRLERKQIDRRLRDAIEKAKKTI